MILSQGCLLNLINKIFKNIFDLTNLIYYMIWELLPSLKGTMLMLGVTIKL